MDSCNNIMILLQVVTPVKKKLKHSDVLVAHHPNVTWLQVTLLWIQTRRLRNWCSTERLPYGIPMEKLDPSDLLVLFGEKDWCNSVILTFSPFFRVEKYHTCCFHQILFGHNINHPRFYILFVKQEFCRVSIGSQNYTVPRQITALHTFLAKIWFKNGELRS